MANKEGTQPPHLDINPLEYLTHSQMREIHEASIKVHALPNLSFTMCNGLGEDIRADIQYPTKYALMIRNTTKPQVIIAEDQQNLKDIIEIASCVVGSPEKLKEKPLFCLYAEPTSPLVHPKDSINNLLFMAEHSLPINYSPGIMAGASGPVTVAGVITLANAEILTGLVIHQLKNPGAPFVFGAGMSPLDMSSAQPTYSAPEAMMAQAGLCQMGRALYQLPRWGFAGCSASKLADEQAINEATSYIMMSHWMGSNINHDVGYLEFGLTYSYDLLVICNEVIGQVRHMANGIQVDAAHLAVDAIKRVGPGGHFFEDRHTVKNYRKNWMPGITDRQTFKDWEAEGATTMCQRAKTKVKHILENHQPPPLPDEVNRQIDNILQTIQART